MSVQEVIGGTVGEFGFVSDGAQGLARTGSRMAIVQVVMVVQMTRSVSVA